jgi:hypothetical protein
MMRQSSTLAWSVVVLSLFGLYGCGLGSVGPTFAVPSMPSMAPTSSVPPRAVLHWAVFTDPQTGASAELPGVPVSDRTTLFNTEGPPIPAWVHKTATTDSGVVNFVVADTLPDHHVDLDAAVRGNVDALGGSVSSTHTVTPEGYPAVDVEIHYLGPASHEPALLLGHWVLAHGRQFNVTTRAVGKLESAVRQVHERVVQRLHIP